MEEFFLGVEIGASKHQVALGNRNGDILIKKEGSVVLEDGARGILAWMSEHIADMIAKTAGLKGSIEAIGVGFGGIVESRTGKSLVSVQVDGWKDFNLKDWFEESFRLPTYVLNDTVAGGYGELFTGSGKGSKSFFYTNIGSGIGGAFFFNGNYYDGIGYGAAYFGHTYIPDWTSSVPGVAIKVEDMCSGFGIERRLRQECYVPGDSYIMKLCNGKQEDIKCIMLEEAARAGDKFALAEIDRIAQSYSIGLSNVITLISPDCISIGGGVAKMGDMLLEPIRRYTDEKVFISAKDRYRIVGCRHEDNAVLVGSILYASAQQ